MIKRISLYVLLLLICPLAVLICLVSQPVLSRNVPSAARVDPVRLKAHVRKLSVDFYPRSYINKDNLARCVGYIGRELALSGAEITFQKYEIRGETYTNVIAAFPSENSERIIIGAHYDACADTPGADDNASGVAGLIELAHLLSKARLKHTVELVAYCTEEPPFFGSENMGSAHHAKRLRANGIQVPAMISLEMIGYFSDERNSQSYPAEAFRLLYPSRGNYIAVAGDIKQHRLIRAVKAGMRGSTDLPINSVCVPRILSWVGYSDQRSYWEEGYPGIMVTDTAFLRNNRYHERGDTADRLDYRRMSKVVIGVFEAVKAID